MDRDEKYRLAVVKVKTGEPIPDDEPWFLLRARDHLAIQTLRAYRDAALSDHCTDYHLQGINERIAAFEQFAQEHPERMKQPGCTRGLQKSFRSLMKTATKYAWPWRWPKTSSGVKDLMLSFYKERRRDITANNMFAAGPLEYCRDGAFLFSEGWEKGDIRFGKPNFKLRFGWQTATANDPNRFRLCVCYNRFNLTLPFVTSGIKRGRMETFELAARNAETVRRYGVLKRLVETKRHVYITTKTSEVIAEVVLASSGVLETGVNLDNVLDKLENAHHQEPFFGDGHWCQNCSRVRVEKAGDYCPSCHEILTTFRSARASGYGVALGLSICPNCFERRQTGENGICLTCSGLKQMRFKNGIRVVEECYRCHRFGRKDAEFLSPYNGLCAECNRKEKEAKESKREGKTLTDSPLFICSNCRQRTSRLEGMICDPCMDLRFNHVEDVAFCAECAKFGTKTAGFLTDGEICSDCERKVKEKRENPIPDPLDGGPHGLATPAHSSHSVSYFSHWYDAKLNVTFAKLQFGTLDKTYEVPGKVSASRLMEILALPIEVDIRRAKEGQDENPNPVDGGPHGLAGTDPAA